MLDTAEAAQIHAVQHEIVPAALNASDAARYLNLSVASVWELAKERKIEVRRTIGRTLFMRRGLDAYLESLPSNLEAAA